MLQSSGRQLGSRIMKKMFSVIVSILAALMLVHPAWAANEISVKGSVNGRDIDTAVSRDTAIVINSSPVKLTWNVKNNTSSEVTITKVSADYFFLAPSYDISLNSKIAAGGTDTRTITANVPDFVTSLKGYFDVAVSVYDSGGRVVYKKNVWVKLGEGSPLTGPVGGVGAGLGAAAIAGGGISVARGARSAGTPVNQSQQDNAASGEGQVNAEKPRRKRRGGVLRDVSSLAMTIAVALIMIALGMDESGVAIAAVASGLGENVAVRLLTRLFG